MSNWEWFALDALGVVGGIFLGLGLMGAAFVAVFFRNLIR